LHATYPRVHNGSIAPVRDLVHQQRDSHDLPSLHSVPAKTGRGMDDGTSLAAFNGDVRADLKVEGGEGGREGGREGERGERAT